MYCWAMRENAQNGDGEFGITHPTHLAAHRPERVALLARRSACTRRDAEDDIEASLDLAGLRSFDRLEIDRDRFAGFCVANAAVDAIALILRVAFDVTLRSEFLCP